METAHPVGKQWENVWNVDKRKIILIIISVLFSSQTNSNDRDGILPLPG